jgi:hypothetical protein
VATDTFGLNIWGKGRKSPVGATPLYGVK